eukprot:gene6166-6404_t
MTDNKKKDWAGGQLLFCGGTDWAMLGRSGGKSKQDAQKELERQERYPNLLEPHKFKILLDVKIAFIAAGSSAVHCIAGDVNGVCYTWGRNEKGQLGHGDLLQRNNPTPVSALEGKHVSAASGGKHHTAVVLQTGESWTWGLNGQGQLGTGSIRKGKNVGEDTQLLPVKALVEEVGSVAAGVDFTIWLTKGGQVFSAASIKIMYEPQPTPKAVEALLGHTIKQVACGHTHTIALDDKGAAFTWGNGNYGKLGHKCSIGLSYVENNAWVVLVVQATRVSVCRLISGWEPEPCSKTEKLPVFEPAVAVEEAAAVEDDAGGAGSSKAAGGKRKAAAAGGAKGKKAK